MTSDEQSAASVPTTSSVVDGLADALRSGTILDLHGATIPADLIRDTLLGKPHGDDKKPVIALVDIDPRGLRITNAVITGPLDLNNTHIGAAFEITQSQLTDGMTLQNARLDHELNLEGCSLPSLDMIGGHITGQLIMRGAQLTGTDQDGASLNGDGLQVDGSVFLKKGFTATGAIRLRDAHITGQLNMRDARLTGTDGASLIGDGLQVDGDVLLDDKFTATGAIRLPGARITGQLNMRDAQLTGTDQDGASLNGDRLQVDSDMLLDDITATGAIRLPGARITGQLDMRGAQLTGTDQDGASLNGDRLQVDSDMLLVDGFTAVGAIALSGARLGQLRVVVAGVRSDVGGLRVRTAATPGLTVAGASVGDLRLNLDGVAGSRVPGPTRQAAAPVTRAPIAAVAGELHLHTPAAGRVGHLATAAAVPHPRL